MSHGDWQSRDVFVVIMVIIMSHNRIKLFHCFADALFQAYGRCAWPLCQLIFLRQVANQDLKLTIGRYRRVSGKLFFTVRLSIDR